MTTDDDADDDVPDPADALVRADGRPLRFSAATVSDVCPSCGAPPSRRVSSSGFGVRHDVCGACGFEFAGESTR